MPISSLPDECFNIILFFLDNNKTLYKCLFINRYYCKFTIPLIWREPFIRIPRYYSIVNNSLINTLVSCLNEDEISSLIPCAINFNNDQTPLFEYGNFVRKFCHDSCVSHVIAWLGKSSQDLRVQKLVNVIYHMIMRQGANLQEFYIEKFRMVYFYTDLPKFSIFTTYEPGITNLRKLKISFNED